MAIGRAVRRWQGVDGDLDVDVGEAEHVERIAGALGLIDPSGSAGRVPVW